MADATVIIRTADKTRKASVTLPGSLTIQQLLNTTQQKWNLPTNTNYALRLDRTGQELNANTTLDSSGIRENDVLEVFPILEAGG